MPRIIRFQDAELRAVVNDAGKITSIIDSNGADTGIVASGGASSALAQAVSQPVLLARNTTFIGAGSSGTAVLASGTSQVTFTTGFGTFNLAVNATPGMYLYYPALALSPSQTVAGYYWTRMSSPTVGLAYNNQPTVFNANGGWAVPTALVSFADAYATGTAFTQPATTFPYLPAYNVPAGAMGANSRLQVIGPIDSTTTNSTLVVRFGGVGAAAVGIVNNSPGAALQGVCLQNDNSLTAQTTYGYGGNMYPVGSSATINTVNSFTVDVAVSLGQANTPFAAGPFDIWLFP